MEHDHYVMLARRLNQLRERNKEIQKKQLELEQEYNRNKLEIEDVVVKKKKAEDSVGKWKGVKSGKS